MTIVINVPEKDITASLEDNNNSNQEQTNEEIRHLELMCKLDDINTNLKILNTYFSLLTNNTIEKEDV